MKGLIRFFNLIFLVLAIIAGVSFFNKPFVELDVSAYVPKEKLTQLVYPSIENKISEDEWNEALNKIEGDKVGTDVSASVPSSYFFKNGTDLLKQTFDNEGYKAAEKVISTSKPVAKYLVEIIVNRIAKDAVKNGVIDELNRNSPGVIAEEAMETAGISDEYLTGFAESLCKLVIDGKPDYPEDKVYIDDLMCKVSVFDREICHKFAEAGIQPYSIVSDEQIETYCESMDQDIKVDLIKNLERATIATKTSDGSRYEIIPFDNVLNRLIIAVLNKFNGDSSDLNNLINGTSGDSTVEIKAGATDEEVKDKIVEIINTKFGFALTSIEKYGKYIKYGIVFLMFPWLLFAIITLERTFRKRCWAKPWIVFVFAFIEVILGVGLVILSKYSVPIIAKFIKSETIKAVLQVSSFKLVTSSYVPSIIYLIMIPLSIIYALISRGVKFRFIARKRLNRQFKNLD